MPTSGEDTVKKDVLYPDQLVGETLVIDEGWDLLDGEVQFWDAADPDDKKALPDGAKNGWWLPVQSAERGTLWIACPLQLREAILELQPGDAFEVIGMAPGQGENDPYDVEIAVITR